MGRPEKKGRPSLCRGLVDGGSAGEAAGAIQTRGHSVHGKFSGWSVDSKSFLTTTGLGIGSARTAIAKAYPGTTVDDGPLGVMFENEKSVSGFLNADRLHAHVIGLYAGETCMVS